MGPKNNIKQPLGFLITPWPSCMGFVISLQKVEFWSLQISPTKNPEILINEHALSAH